MRTKLLAIAPMSMALICCGRSASDSADQGAGSHPVQVIETAWNDVAAQRIQSLVAQGKFQYTLPELRIYDADQKLIFREIGDTPTIDPATLNRVIAADRPTAGPSFAETAADLDTADHHPAAARLPANGEVTIFDYWAEWCVGCKVLGKRLTAWAATQPRGAVRIVKAEADLNKILSNGQQANGNGGVEKSSRTTTSRVMKGPDGKLHTVHTTVVKTIVEKPLSRN